MLILWLVVLTMISIATLTISIMALSRLPRQVPAQPPWPPYNSHGAPPFNSHGAPPRQPPPPYVPPPVATKWVPRQGCTGTVTD
jgi:hypothetical protein